MKVHYTAKLKATPTVISQLSSHKIMKKSGFNSFSNLLVSTANQT